MHLVSPGPVRQRVLFIARAYPPTLGGMENFAYQLHSHLAQRADVESIINHRGKKALPIFLPYAAAAAIRRVRSGDFDSIHLADAMLAPVGAAIKAATGIRVTASVCGLDVTYENEIYQRTVVKALRRVDLALPISTATEDAMHARTGALPLSQVIPLGINPLPEPDESAVAAFHSLVARTANGRILLTVGRLIERKGVAWFAEHVLPLLPQHAVYCVIGVGPMQQAIEHAATQAGVADRVHLLGSVSDDVLAAAYSASDMFVMPNIAVSGDMEGFGLVALEASASGLPVVAANLDGIPSAIQHGDNGVLVASQDATAWASEISRMLALPPEALADIGARHRAHTLQTFGWGRTADQYLEAMSGVAVRQERERLAA